MKADTALSVVVPAYNEADRLPGSLARIREFLEATPKWLPAQVLVVDDGSRDGTAAVVQELRAAPEVRVAVMRLAANRGKGAAVRAGLAAATGRMVLVSDADLAAPIEEIDVLAAAGADVAVGSRALRRELISVRQPPQRDHLGRLFNLYLRALGLTQLHDTQCGFKLIEGRLARELAGHLRLERFAFDVELLARAVRLGATVVEVPVRWRHVEASRVRPLRDGLRMVWDATRLRWWLWSGR